ncbi:hypothetical protein CsSME_00040883 [Camellia sinensis var. sinensis]
MVATWSSPRTLSKNKWVGPSGTEGIVDGLDHAHKCVRDAILAGRRVGTTITKTRYNEIALKFAKRTGRRHDITQLKNKYISLKKECKGVTGIGFDRETGLFTTNKIAYKFKTKPLEHEDLIREKAVDVGEGESDSVDSPRLAPFTEPYRPVVNSPPNSPTIHLEEADPGTKRKNGGSTSGKSKKVSNGASVLVDSFNHLSKAVEAQKHLTVRHETSASQKYGIEPCMQWFMAILDFISTPLFHFACTVLENTDYREILMCMPNDENVVNWLAALQVSKGLSNYRNYDDVIIELTEKEEDLQKSVIGDAVQHTMEYYLKYMEKIPCRTSILTGHAWIQELFDGHVGKHEQNLHMPLYASRVEAVLPARDAGTYYGRKRISNPKHVSRSMHNSRIFKEIIENEHAPFPHPQEGKYYFVDVGYPNKKGYLAPYKGSRYHQAQFRDRGRPDNPRELFNEAHVPLRSVLERTFGVWNRAGSS